MSRGELRLELLLGREVSALNGRSIGRLEEVRAARKGTGCLVTEYWIGPAGLFERLAAPVLPFRWGPFRFGNRGYIARWDQLDASDPTAPRLLCPVEELERAPTGRSVRRREGGR
jgi:hypothetical protein